MNVLFLPVDENDNAYCSQCGVKATLVEIFSGHFFCNKCSNNQEINPKYPFEDKNYFEN
jgi:hypothetical protein